MRINPSHLALIGAAALCSAMPQAASAQSSADALAGTTIENLTQMQVEVSSFARKNQDLWKTPAAVFVISQQDIAHSAASSIPELLRMVPGMQVAQVGAGVWAISARGFNSVYADKLLVLIDGRTMYSEIYSGVHWDQIDLPLDDVERIEIIRGPGAAIWGTNAVNGIVNIITKKARKTTGTQAAAQVSRTENLVNVRYGGTLGDRTQFRAFTSFLDRLPLELSNGTNAFDGENTLRAGGRLDWQRTWSDSITLSGDLYGGHLHQRVLPEIALPGLENGRDDGSIAGGYVLGAWEHHTGTSSSALQVYFDDQSRHELGDRSRTRTTDFDYQAHRPAGERNDLVWGGEYRLTADHISGPVLVTTQPEYHHYLADAFLQDDLTLVPSRLTLTLGSKIEQGSLAGFQLQPSARMLWLPSSSQAAWAAVSRAVVAPALQERSILIPLNLGLTNGVQVNATVTGNPAFKPEYVNAFEAGYRRHLPHNVSIDLAGFYNRSHRLTSIGVEDSPIAFTPAPTLNVTLPYGNAFGAQTVGLESVLTWKPIDQLALRATETWMQAHTVQHIPGNMTIIDSWGTPTNSYNASATWQFLPRWTADAFLDRVGAISAPSNGSFGSLNYIPAYTRVDIHVARAIGHSVEFAAGGTNLLTPRHLEFLNGADLVVPDFVPRSLFLRAKWSF